MSDNRLRRIACCDIEELDFEEELVAGFIRTVKNFQEFSDQVEVVLFPRNTKWIHYSPEVQEKLNRVLDRIREETGVQIRDYQQLDSIGPEHFRDTTHLARYTGEVVFTDHLVEEYGPDLGTIPEAER